MKKDVIKTVKKTIEENRLVSTGDHVVLGLSGGPDSMCLFSVLMNLMDEIGFTMETVHINHKFRPGEAEEDQKYVEEYCMSAGIKCTSFEINCMEKALSEGLSPEEAGREARYAAFDMVSKEHGGNVKIAVAQNMDDQCETMLFRLIRGTGPDGLAAIRYSRKSDKGFDIIRPLLDVSRKSIEEYLNECEISPRIDRTNSETIYTRNRIRLELIPYIEDNFNPKFRSSLLRLARSLNDDRAYFDEYIPECLAEVKDEAGAVVLERYAKYERGIRHRMLAIYINEAGALENVSMIHINSVDRLCLYGKTSDRCDLPGGYTALISYGRLLVRKKGEKEEPSEKRKVRAVFSKSELLDAFGTYEYEIRKRRPGDYIHISSGRKKVKELFIDMKIPAEKRDDIDVVAIGSEVLWIPGIRYSDRYRCNSSDDALSVETFVYL